MSLHAAETAPSRAAVDDAMQYADWGLALAGHELTDPVLRELARQTLAKEITFEEAKAEGMAHLHRRAAQ